jgi:signal transduction histidine kinase
MLQCEVADNGRGFAPSGDEDGNGLRGLRQRAAALGGGIEIDSRENQGASVRFQLPLSMGRKNRTKQLSFL